MKFVCKLFFLIGFFAWMGFKECFPADCSVGVAYEDKNVVKAKNAAFAWLMSARSFLQARSDLLTFLLDHTFVEPDTKLDDVKKFCSENTNFFSLQHIHMLTSFTTVAEIEKFLDQCVHAFEERKLNIEALILSWSKNEDDSQDLALDMRLTDDELDEIFGKRSHVKPSAQPLPAADNKEDVCDKKSVSLALGDCAFQGGVI